MTKATLHPSGLQFDVLPDSSLLQSGLSAGIALPFACANGSCGECRARIASGTINKIRPHDYTLTVAQKLQGQCLLCSYTATTDVELEVFEAKSIADIPEQSVSAKLDKIEDRVNLEIVTLKLRRGKALRFLPGQSIALKHSDGSETVLPIASCPCNAGTLELHLCKTTDIQNKSLLNHKKTRETIMQTNSISLRGPIGEFTFTGDTHKPKILCAKGADFAYLQGMIEHILYSELNTPCTLIWEATPTISHYQANLCRSWQDAFDEFTFLPSTQEKQSLELLKQAWNSHSGGSEVYLAANYPCFHETMEQLGDKQIDIYFPIH